MTDKVLLDIKMDRLFLGFLETVKRIQESILFLMVVIIKANIKKVFLTVEANLDGLMVLDIMVFGVKVYKMVKVLKYTIIDNKEVYGKMGFLFNGDDT